MTDRRTIIDTFARLEAEAGGYAAVGGDAKTVAERVAGSLGLTYDAVKEVLIEEWTRPT